MNKLIVLVLALAIAAPALADDLIPAPWANDGSDGRIPGLPGSTYQQWTYDDPCDVYDWDAPEVSFFVTGLMNLDGVTPAGDPCSWGDPAFSMQVWGDNGDPCQPNWFEDLPVSRSGGINFLYGSWDLNNFIDDLPAKDMWVQITYWTGGTGPGEVDWMEAGYPDPDPCFVPVATGWWEGFVADWEGPDPEWDTWLDDPCDPGSVFAEWEGPLEDLDPCNTSEMDTWMSEGELSVEDWTLESSEVLGDGWIHEVFSATIPTNPDWEYFAFGMVDAILIDQIIIETISYVPEPATMVLLGLGSLMMIRRKKR